MLTHRKLLLIILIITIGVFTVQLFFLIKDISQKNKNKTTQTSTTQGKTNLAITQNPTSPPLSSPVESNLENYIPQIKKQWSGYFDIISSVPNSKDYSVGICQNSHNPCLYFENKTGDWYEINSTQQISVTRPFVIRLGLNVTNTLSAILLRGKPPQNGDPWWKGTTSLLIGYDTNGTRLYVDARNGTKPEPFVLGTKQLLEANSQNKPGILYIIVDPNSENMLFLNQKFEKILSIDTNQITNNAFPNGLFPGKYFTPRIGLTPNSKMILTDFTIMPL